MLNTPNQIFTLILHLFHSFYLAQLLFLITFHGRGRKTEREREMEKHFLNKIEPLIPYLCQAKHTGISTSETFYIN